MSDLADLGLRFHTEGGEQAVSTLDQVATKAERAERATDSLAKGSSRASRATDALAGSSRSTAQAVGRLAGDLANGGSATEALGRSLPALAGGLGIGATGFLALGAAAVIAWDQVERYREGQERLEALANGVGAAVGLSARAIEAAAQAGARASKISVAAAEEQAIEYAKTGRIGTETLTGLMELTQRYAEATGVDAKSAVSALGKAFAEPETGARKLAGSLAFLNAAQLEQVETLAREGRLLEAQNLMREQLNRALPETAAQVRGLAGAWNVVANAARDAWREMLKAAGGGDTLTRLQVERQKLDRMRFAPLGIESDLKRQTGIVRDLTAQLNREVSDARTRQATAAANRESIEFQERLTRAQEAALPKEVALRKIQEQRAVIQKAVADGTMKAAEAQRYLNGLDKQAADLAKTPKVPKSDAQKEAERAAKLLKQQEEATQRYIERLREEIEETGLAAEAVRRLSSAREIEKALKRGDVESAALIHSLRLEQELRADLAKQLEEAIESTQKLRKEVVGLTTAEQEWGDVVLTTKERATDALRRVVDVADEVTFAVYDIDAAFRNNDWMGAVRGLLNAIEAVKKAQKELGTFGAVATAANAVGQAIGGTAGSAISGAASGAMVGLTLGAKIGAIGGPLGAGIGAVIGGIAGLFSGNKAKKEQQRQEAERRAQEEAARQAAILNQKRDLELEIIRMTGTAAEVLAAERARELEGIDASNVALQERIYALQDEKAAADAAAAAAAKLKEARDFFDANFLTDAERIAPVMAKVTAELEALGLAGVNTIAKFRDAVLGADQSTASGKALYESLLALAPDFKSVVDFQDQALQASQASARASDAASDAASKWLSVAEQLRAYSQRLAGVSALTESPLASYGQARGALASVEAGIRARDGGAFDRLQEVGDAFIEAARRVSTDPLDEVRAIARVRALADEAATNVQGANFAQQTAENTADTNAKIQSLLDQIARLQIQLQDQAGKNDARVATLERVILGLENGDITISTSEAA